MHLSQCARRARTIAGFTLLGMMTALAVAWGAALLIPTAAIPFPTSVADAVRLSEDEVTWLYVRSETLGATTLAVISMKYDPIIGLYQRYDRVDPRGAPPWSDIRNRAPAAEPYTEVEDAHVEFARGWPMRAMAGRRLFSDRAFIHCGVMRGPAGAWREALALDLPPLDSYLMHDARALPLRPIWPGLIVDTAFWASAWYASLLLPGGVRRVWRRRRNRCESCGYDLRGHTARRIRCPECGRDV